MRILSPSRNLEAQMKSTVKRNKFFIVKEKETGITYLAIPYWLDPSQKFTVLSKYKEGKNPVIKKYGLGFNLYKNEVEVVGTHVSTKYAYTSQNEIVKLKDK